MKKVARARKYLFSLWTLFASLNSRLVPVGNPVFQARIVSVLKTKKLGNKCIYPVNYWK
jgi:hypothetical protein